MSRRAKHKKRIVSAVSARTGPTLLAAGGQISLEISGIVVSFEGSDFQKNVYRNLRQGQVITDPLLYCTVSAMSRNPAQVCVRNHTQTHIHIHTSVHLSSARGVLSQGRGTAPYIGTC